MFKRASFPLYCVLIMLGCSEDTPPGPPLAPSRLIAKAISPREIKLSWTDLSNDEHGFRIERTSGSQFLEIALGLVNASGYTDKLLIPGTEYSYRVSSYNFYGTSYSNVARATTIDQPIPVQVTTEMSGAIGMASALGMGSFNLDAYPEVSTCGFVWSTVPNPTIELDSKTVFESGGNNIWFSVIGELEPSAKYHLKAYATNELGTVYGNEITFTTSHEPLFRPGNGVVDIEGNSYKTVIIGVQEWMAENLRTTTFANGEKIPNITNSEQWAELKSPAWCHYDNDPQYDGVQGKMYNWYAASDSPKLCPFGWHVPTTLEWTELEDYLGGSYIAGVRLKSPLPSWTQPDLSTNESGFAAVHSGTCQPCGGLYSTAEWWTSSKVGPYEGIWVGDAFTFSVSAGRELVLGGMGIYPATVGLCVRCVKN